MATTIGRAGPGSYGIPDRRALLGFTKTQKLVGGAFVVALVVGIAVATLITEPPSAGRVSVFGGSVTLDNAGEDPVVVDLATGLPALRLSNAYTLVDGTSRTQLAASQVTNGTALVNTTSGDFNFLGPDDVAAGPSSGVVLPGTTSTAASAVASGNDAFVVRYGTHAQISKVSPALVAQAKHQKKGDRLKVPDLVTGAISDRTGVAAAATGQLFAVEKSTAKNSANGVLDRFFENGGALRKKAVESIPTDAVLMGADYSDGAGDPQLVGVASEGRIELETPQGDLRTANFDSNLGGTIVGVGDVTTAGWFAYGSGTHWTLVKVPTDKSDPVQRVALRGLSTSHLIDPVFDRGLIYAMATRGDTSPPRLVTIDPSTGKTAPVKGAAVYPTKKDEAASFSDEQVLAFGPRVIFNNPASALGVTVFADHSHATIIFDKNSVASFDPAAPAGDINAPKTKTTQPKSTTAHKTTPPPAAQQVNNQVNCQVGGQKPHAPHITSLNPAPHSMEVTWSYQTEGSEDCYPQSWEVTVTGVGSSPNPPQQIAAVQDQTQYDFTGLESGSTYSFVVTAFIGNKSTPSTPAKGTTSQAGPDAPTSVSTVATGSGWKVSWTKCQKNCQNPVPLQTWVVSGSVCGGSSGSFGVTQTVNGSDNEVTIPFSTSTPVGTSLSFSVKGEGTNDIGGTPTSDGTCTEGWSQPDPSQIALNATATPTSKSGQNETEVIQATSLSGAAAWGSDEPQFTFSVTGPSGFNWQSQTQSSPTVKVPGLSAHVTYTAVVVVYPRGHPSATGTAKRSFETTTLSWPEGVTIQSASGTITADNADLGSVTAQVAALYSDGSQSTTFTASVTLRCGNDTQAKTNVTISHSSGTSGTLTITGITVVTFGGACTIGLTVLSDAANGEHGGSYIGSLGSPAPFTLGTLGSLKATQFSSKITLTAVPYTGTQVTTIYAASGPGYPATVGKWTVTVKTTVGGNCSAGTTGAVAATLPAQLPSVDLSSCVQNEASSMVEDSGTFKATVTITHHYLGATTAPATETVTQGINSDHGPSIATITDTATASGGFAAGDTLIITGDHLHSVTTVTLTEPSASFTRTLGLCSAPSASAASTTCFVITGTGSTAKIIFKLPSNTVLDPTKTLTGTQPLKITLSGTLGSATQTVTYKPPAPVTTTTTTTPTTTTTTPPATTTT